MTILQHETPLPGAGHRRGLPPPAEEAPTRRPPSRLVDLLAADASADLGSVSALAAAAAGGSRRPFVGTPPTVVSTKPFRTDADDTAWALRPGRSPIGLRSAEFALVDVAALAVAWAAGAAMVPGAPALAAGLAAGAGLLFVALSAAGAHRVEGAAAAHPARTRVIAAAAAAAVVAGLIAPGAALPPGAAGAAATVLAGSLVLLPSVASLHRRLLRHPPFDERILLIGSGALARSIAQGLERHRQLGFRIVGHLSPAGPAATALGPRLGDPAELAAVLRAFEVDRIVIAAEALDAESEEQLVEARLRGVPVESGATWFEWLYERLPLDASRRRLLLETSGFETSALFSCAKRALDLAVSAAALAVLAPALGAAAVAIKLDSPGPVLYGQMRLGRGGRPFRLWKLRSMCDDAERTSGAVCADDGDPRVTRIGAFLRRSRLDEIPQLWNVLRGDMSIVGPRPERPELARDLVERFPLFRYRTAVRPGITGWAQVRQGYVNELDGFGLKLSYDLFYLKNRSLGLDLRVLWHTAWELLQMKGV